LHEIIVEFDAAEAEFFVDIGHTNAGAEHSVEGRRDHGGLNLIEVALRVWVWLPAI